MSEKSEKEKTSALLNKAMKAYGIRNPEHILSVREEKDNITIVTHGGMKVTYKDYMEVEELTPEQISGQIRKLVKKN